jgi:hypothetical protein
MRSLMELGKRVVAQLAIKVFRSSNGRVQIRRRFVICYLLFVIGLRGRRYLPFVIDLKGRYGHGRR